MPLHISSMQSLTVTACQANENGSLSCVLTLTSKPGAAWRIIIAYGSIAPRSLHRHHKLCQAWGFCCTPTAAILSLLHTWHPVP